MYAREKVLMVVVAALVLAVPPAASRADESASLPRAEEIVRKALDRMKEADAEQYYAHYTFSQRAVVEKLDERGAVKERSEELYRVYPVEGLPFQELVERNGAPLSDKERKKQEERLRKLRQARSQKKGAGEEDEMTIRLDEETASRFRFEVLARESINGRSAFVLSLEPKKGKLPVRKKVDNILNRLAGKIWIDEQAYEIAKVDVHLTEPVRLWLGILASIRHIEFSLQQQEIDSGPWFPARFDMLVEGRVLFSSIHERQRVEWNGFERFAQ
ncbi:MAG: hypothetical protein AB1714_01095 [Acidobacteriota bacterium]